MMMNPVEPDPKSKILTCLPFVLLSQLRRLYIFYHMHTTLDTLGAS